MRGNVISQSCKKTFTSSVGLHHKHAVPAAVLWVALSHCLLQLHIEKGQLLPALLLLHLVKDGRVEVIHGVSCLQQEVVPHGLEIFQQPEEMSANSNAP